MFYSKHLLSTALLAFGVTLTALAADSAVDNAKSSIIATFKQEGVAVDSPFKRFSGQIHYDAKNIATSTASIDVETGSLDIGDEAYNAEVRKESWFNSAKYPKASFRSTAIKADSAGHFTATGTLTVKGRVLTINVPITAATTAAGTAFDGTFNISRKAFGIGDPIWDDVLEDTVKVRFHLLTTP